jgi:hypothetical protein
VSGGWIRRSLLRWYPPAWRARYGEELEQLIVESSRGKRVPLRIWANVAAGGMRERLRASGLTGDAVPPGERSRAGTLLVLCAWALFVVGGMIVQKSSEHWQRLVPDGGRNVPSIAFDTLVAVAAVGTSVILAGVACAIPALVALARSDRAADLRRPLVRAVCATVVAAAATVALVIWAHRLTASQRDGRDLGYELGFAACAVIVVVCLATWTLLAVRVGRCLELAPGVLRLEARLAAAAASSMAVMTVAAAVWWAALARSAANLSSPPLGLALALMVIATALGSMGAWRAVGATPRRRGPI